MSNSNYNIFTDEILVKMAQEGSTTAEEYLIEKYKEVAKIKTKTYFIAGADNEDVVQEGMIGIFKAIRGFDGSKNASFRTFAELCINRQIITAIKTANRKKHQPLNQSISIYTNGDSNGDDGEGVSEIIETLHSGSDTDPETLMVTKEIVDYLIENDNGIFSKFENKVLTEKLKGKDYIEIAAMFHKKPKVVDNALQRIKNKIALYFGYK